jgi:hypothetical protein
MANDASHGNGFVGQNGQFAEELEFRDSQSGFVGESGVIWSVARDGTCRVARFANEETAEPHCRGQLSRGEIALLGKTLLDQDAASLPSQIPSQPSLNPRRLTIRIGAKSSSLLLPAGEELGGTGTAPTKLQAAPRERFIAIAQFIEQLVRRRCRGE